jgi:hypothetical protein
VTKWDIYYAKISHSAQSRVKRVATTRVTCLVSCFIDAMFIDWLVDHSVGTSTSRRSSFGYRLSIDRVLSSDIIPLSICYNLSCDISTAMFLGIYTSCHHHRARGNKRDFTLGTWQTPASEWFERNLLHFSLDPMVYSGPQDSKASSKCFYSLRIHAALRSPRENVIFHILLILSEIFPYHFHTILPRYFLLVFNPWCEAIRQKIILQLNHDSLSFSNKIHYDTVLTLFTSRI